MEKYLEKNFGLPGKNSSPEVLKRWRQAVSIVKDPKRRFCNVADLEKRNEAEEKEKKIKEEGAPMLSQDKKLGSKKEEATIQGRKEEEHVIQIEPEPDAPQMQVAAQSSFNHSVSMAHSGSEIMAYAIPLILVVAVVILGLDFFGVI